MTGRIPLQVTHQIEQPTEHTPNERPFSGLATRGEAISFLLTKSPEADFFQRPFVLGTPELFDL